MGVIETEYSEIRQLTKDILAGNVNLEIATLVLKGYSECGKRTDQYLKVLAMQINHGKAARGLIAKNIISDGVAIDMQSRIEETFKCPAKGDLIITRGGCLDFSGQEHNIDACQKCEHFVTTRKQIFS